MPKIKGNVTFTVDGKQKTTLWDVEQNIIDRWRELYDKGDTKNPEYKWLERAVNSIYEWQG